MIATLPVIGARTVLLLVAVLAPTLFPSGMPGRPDLVVLVVAAAALMHGPVTGALVGLAGGWLVDLVPPGGEPLGAGALSYALAGALVGAARRWAPASPLVPWIAAVGGAVVIQLVRGLTAAAGVGVAHPVDLLWSVAATALFALLVLPVLIGVERFLLSRGWA
ncbi:rod shape-determining protein MreD [Ornithinimicrobium sp. F0845]|uniref:rod shape-determining protein MreD n=1 Tax=Ornithinimicrobium sp. F0845 TaxID=2926412 RepID=UPI001FF68D56|nr:rod shape-determining protein MreD [Ornithinimicrobium sp. F0845]MCK0111531.1 rod shape-determining protein MreD [Ornithinimicrobium sp. F0845]